MLGKVIGGLKVVIGADTKSFNEGYANVQRDLSRLGGLAKVAAAGVAVATSAITASAAALTVWTKNSMGTIDAQAKLASRTGGTVTGLQALTRAADLAGVSSGTLTSSLDAMNRKLGEAANTMNGATYDALTRLGLGVEDFLALDLDERLAVLSDRFNELGLSASQQAGILRDFGIRGAEIVNLFEGGGDAIRGARDEVIAFGVAVSDIDAIKIEQANDAMTTMGMVTTGIGNQMATRLAPIIEGIADLFYDVAQEAGGFGDAIDRAIDLAAGVMGVFADQIVHTQTDFLQMEKIGLQVAAAISGAWAGLAENIAGVMDGIREGWNAIASVIPGLDGMVNNNSYAEWAARMRADANAVEEKLASVTQRITDIKDAPLPSEALQDWLQGVRDKAEETAEETLRTRQALAELADPDWGDDTGDDDDKGKGKGGGKASAAEKLLDRLGERLLIVQESLMAEEEAEQASYERRLEELDEFLENQLISRQEHAELVETMTRQHEERLAEIRQRAMEMEHQRFSQMAGYVTGTLQSISQIMDSEGDKQIGIQKAISLAIAGINVAEGISKALTLPFPMNLLAAAQTAAQGMAAIASINRANRGNSGLTSSTVSSTGAASAAPTMPQTMVIRGWDPNLMYSGESVRNMAEGLIEYQRNGGQVVWADS